MIVSTNTKCPFSLSTPATILKVGGGPCGVVGGAGALWVENFNDNTIARVDPVTLKVVKAIRVGVQPWDVAAPAILIREAGGRYTDWSGGPSFESGYAIASNGRVHDEILRAMT
jgi:YVTN family beta-propeller protein